MSEDEEVVSENLSIVVKKAKKPKVTKTPKVKKDLRTIFNEHIAVLDLESIKQPWMAQKSFRLITTASELEAWAIAVLEDTSRHHSFEDHTCPVIAVDTETDGLDTRVVNNEANIKLAGICLSADGIEGLYISVNHEDGNNIPAEDLRRILQNLFDQSHLIFFNAKYDREVLRITLGIVFRDFPYFEDVQILNYLEDPKASVDTSGSGGLQIGGLKALTKARLGFEQIELSQIAKVKASVWNEELQKNTQKTVLAPFTWVPTYIALWYAAGDAITTWLLWYLIKDKARAMKAVHRLDHLLVDTLTWIERQRVTVDVERLNDTISFHKSKLNKLTEELAALSGIENFNPGSTPQLREVLFNKRGMTPVEFSEKTQEASTAIGVLTELKKQYPEDEFLDKLLAFREYAALHPENLKYEPRDHTARIYFKQNVVAGGRLAAAGGEFEKDGGCGLNPQAIKKVGGNWWVKGKLLTSQEVTGDEPQFNEIDLDPSCFKDGNKAPNIEGNHFGTYFGKRYCLVPSCNVCQGNKTKVDVNEVINLRGLFIAEPGWTYFTTDYCLAPSTRLLTPDLRWVTIRDLQEGDELVGFDEYLPPKELNKKGRRRLRTTVIEKKKIVVKDCLEIKTDKGTVICSIDHSWLAKVRGGGPRSNRLRGLYDWRQADQLKSGMKIAYFCDVWEEDKSWEAGYLSGVFDGEGWVSGQTVGFGQNPGLVLDKVESLLLSKGYNVVRDRPKSCKVDTLRFNGGRIETFKFLGKIRPERIIKNAKKIWEGQTYQSKTGVAATILSITPVGKQEVIALQTSTHTFIAEGMLSHNCNVEMRVAANVSGEPLFLDEFLNGEGDFHSLTARALFPEFSDPNTSKGRKKQLRSLSKIINFALLYGGTAYTIFENMVKDGHEITFEEAQTLVNKYWESVPVFAAWCEGKRNTARTKLMCKTPTGRIIGFHSAMKHYKISIPKPEHKEYYYKYRELKRSVEVYKKQDMKDEALAAERAANALYSNPESGVKNYGEYTRFLGKAERVSINIPLQGTAGDLMRSALNKIRIWATNTPGVEDVFKLHCTVHDEIDFSVKNEFAPYIVPRLNRFMKLRQLHTAKEWKVPLETDCEYGQTWDIDYHLTGDKDHEASGWYDVPGMQTYIPQDFDENLVNKLVSSLLAEKIEKVTGWLKVNTHSRTHSILSSIEKAKTEELMRRHIVTMFQLDEFWRIDEDEAGALEESVKEYADRNRFELPEHKEIAIKPKPTMENPDHVEVEPPSSNPEWSIVATYDQIDNKIEEKFREKEVKIEVEVKKAEEESLGEDDLFYESPKKAILAPIPAIIPKIKSLTERELSVFIEKLGIGSATVVFDYQGTIMKLANVSKIPPEYIQ